MAKCNICSHYSGLWGDSGCSYAPYCSKCIHYHKDLVDNFTPTLDNSNELQVYEYLKNKFEK